jgi:hypothetical protein
MHGPLSRFNSIKDVWDRGNSVPYEVSFSKVFAVPDSGRYINPCCWGGDVVTAEFLPAVRGKYESIHHEQEDWGWFIWFRSANRNLAVDICCDDAESGAFRIRLTESRKRLILPAAVEDGPELDELRDLVVAQLRQWTGAEPLVERVKSP